MKTINELDKMTDGQINDYIQHWVNVYPDMIGDMAQKIVLSHINTCKMFLDLRRQSKI